MLWSEYQVWRRLRDGRAASRNVLLAVTATRLYALEVRRGLRRWYVWGSLGDWPRDRLDVTLVEPDALAITWAEPVTGTVREMKPALSEDASEVVRLLTERVGQISTDDTSG
jgi:hypothetical protein